MSKLQLIFPDLDMVIADGYQFVVATPLIGPNGTSTHNSVLHEGCEAATGGIRKNTETNPPNAFVPLVFHSNSYQYFACRPTPPFARLFSTNKGFIYFNDTRQIVTSGAYHGTPQFMQPGPSCAVAPQTKYPFQAKCTRSIFLSGYPPYCPKPNRQRFMGILKNRPRDYRQLVMTTGAFVQHITNRPGFETVTSRTGKAVWPSQVKKIVTTGFLRRKPTLKFSQIFGVFFHTPEHYM